MATPERYNQDPRGKLSMQSPGLSPIIFPKSRGVIARDYPRLNAIREEPSRDSDSSNSTSRSEHTKRPVTEIVDKSHATGHSYFPVNSKRSDGFDYFGDLPADESVDHPLNFMSILGESILGADNGHSSSRHFYEASEIKEDSEADLLNHSVALMYKLGHRILSSTDRVNSSFDEIIPPSSHNIHSPRSTSPRLSRHATESLSHQPAVPRPSPAPTTANFPPSSLDIDRYRPASQVGVASSPNIFSSCPPTPSSGTARPPLRGRSPTIDRTPSPPLANAFAGVAANAKPVPTRLTNASTQTEVELPLPPPHVLYSVTIDSLGSPVLVPVDNPTPYAQTTGSQSWSNGRITSQMNHNSSQTGSGQRSDDQRRYSNTEVERLRPLPTSQPSHRRHYRESPSPVPQDFSELHSTTPPRKLSHDWTDDLSVQRLDFDDDDEHLLAGYPPTRAMRHERLSREGYRPRPGSSRFAAPPTPTPNHRHLYPPQSEVAHRPSDRYSMLDHPSYSAPRRDASLYWTGYASAGGALSSDDRWIRESYLPPWWQQSQSHSSWKPQQREQSSPWPSSATKLSEPLSSQSRFVGNSVGMLNSQYYRSKIEKRRMHFSV